MGEEGIAAGEHGELDVRDGMFGAEFPVVVMPVGTGLTVKMRIKT